MDGQQNIQIYREVGLFTYLWWVSRQLSWYSDQTMEWTTEECWFNSRQWQQGVPSVILQGFLFSASFSPPFTTFKRYEQYLISTITFTTTMLCGHWRLIRYSDSLRAERLRRSNPRGGEIFCTRPDRLWRSHSLLYNGYRVSFKGVKRLGRGFNHPPHLDLKLKKE